MKLPNFDTFEPLNNVRKKMGTSMPGHLALVRVNQLKELEVDALAFPVPEPVVRAPKTVEELPPVIEPEIKPEPEVARIELPEEPPVIIPVPPPMPEVAEPEEEQPPKAEQRVIKKPVHAKRIAKVRAPRKLFRYKLNFSKVVIILAANAAVLYLLLSFLAGVAPEKAPEIQASTPTAITETQPEIKPETKPEPMAEIPQPPKPEPKPEPEIAIPPAVPEPQLAAPAPVEPAPAETANDAAPANDNNDNAAANDDLPFDEPAGEAADDAADAGNEDIAGFEGDNEAVAEAGNGGDGLDSGAVEAGDHAGGIGDVGGVGSVGGTRNSAPFIDNAGLLNGKAVDGRRRVQGVKRIYFKRKSE